MTRQELKILTKEEIVEKLKSMNIDNKKIFYFHIFSFIIVNPDYNPEAFSQEIEDSEEEINSLDLISDEMHKSDFDFVFHNTLCRVPWNSKKWLENHSKICKVKFIPNKFIEQCVNHRDGTRNYYSEKILNKILEIGNIVNFW